MAARDLFFGHRRSNQAPAAHLGEELTRFGWHYKVVTLADRFLGVEVHPPGRDSFVTLYDPRLWKRAVQGESVPLPGPVLGGSL